MKHTTIAWEADVLPLNYARACFPIILRAASGQVGTLFSIRERLEDRALYDTEMDEEAAQREALEAAGDDGIVFIDGIDKVTARSEREGTASFSREGVQREPSVRLIT